MGNIIGLIGGLLIGIILNTFVFWIVGKLGIGMKVENLGTALKAAFFVGLLNLIASLIWDVLGVQSVNLVTHIIITAGFLLSAGKKIKGMEVKNFVSALVASLAVAGVTWLVNYLAGMVL